MSDRDSIDCVRTEKSADSPSIAAAADGRLWLVWKNVPERPEELAGGTVIMARTLKKVWGGAWKLYETENQVDSLCVVSGKAGTPQLFWLEEVAGQWHLRTGSADGDGITRPRTLSGADGAIHFSATTDHRGRVWVVWQTGRARPYRLLVRRFNNDRWSRQMQVSPRGTSCWRPAISPSSTGGLWLGWDAEEAGTLNIFVRSIRASGRLDNIRRLTNSKEINLDCTVAEDCSGRLWIAWSRLEHWNDLRIYRLNSNRDIYLRCLDPKTGNVFVCDSAEEQHGGRVAALLGRLGGNVVCPSLHIDGGTVHLFFRRILRTGDRTKGVRDWGWSVLDVARDSRGWQKPVRISRTVGYSMNPVSVAQVNSGIFLACQENDCRGQKTPNPMPRVSLYKIPAAPWRKSAAADHVWEIRADPICRPAATAAGRVRPAARQNDERLIWGDMHRHSDLSRCVSIVDGSIWDHYRWARCVAGLDFYCITDHVQQTSNQEWQNNMNLARRFNAPGEFAALLGFEGWGYGVTGMHINIYCVDVEAGILARECALHSEDDLAELCEALACSKLKGRAIVVPHFHAVSCDSSAARLLRACSADFIPAIEVVQTRGFSPEFADAVAGAGIRVAFTGSSDHSSPPWARAWKLVPGWQFQHAITGLWVKEVTVKGVFDGLFRGRAFGTNGVRLMADLKVDGHAMGREFTTSRPPRIRLTAKGTTEILKAEIVCDGKVIHEEPGGESELHLTLNEKTLPRGKHYYYARVRQEPEPGYGYFGEAWTSPVWVSRK